MPTARGVSRHSRTAAALSLRGREGSISVAMMAAKVAVVNEAREGEQRSKATFVWSHGLTNCTETRHSHYGMRSAVDLGKQNSFTEKVSSYPIRRIRSDFKAVSIVLPLRPD